MKKIQLDKERLEDFSAIVSVVIFAIMAIDYLSVPNVFLGALLGIIACINLLILGLRKRNAGLFNIWINFLNAVAAFFICLDEYEQNGRYLLWGGICIAFTFVSIRFVYLYRIYRKLNPRK